MNGVVNIEKTVNMIGKVSSFTVLGDPGCDGLGVEILTTFSKAMNCSRSDFKLILGDIVPFGLKPFYKHIVDIINETSLNPVYSLRGNHDTDLYREFFGLNNYIIVNEDMLIVVLDNSKRVFEPEMLGFLSKVLQEYERKNILLAFHIPPPNKMSPNSFKPDEWAKLRAVMDPFKKNIKYLLAGHVHSYFEEIVDGYKVVVSGGGGARLDFFGKLPDKKSSFYHVLRFYFDNKSELAYEYVSLADKSYDREVQNENIKMFLTEAFEWESTAHLRYGLFADDAHEKGYTGVEKMFRALSRSAFYHAKSYFSVLNQLQGVGYNLKKSRDIENAELELLNSKYLPYAAETHLPLTQYGFYEAFMTKKNNAGLLPAAIDSYDGGSDIEDNAYYVCTTCGNLVRSETEPDHCYICGAPRDKFVKV